MVLSEGVVTAGREQWLASLRRGRATNESLVFLVLPTPFHGMVRAFMCFLEKRA